MSSRPSNGYGAANGSGRHSGIIDDEEQQPLLGGRSTKSKWRNEMMTDIDRDYADIILLACYVVTGLLDSASISTWGSFVSMQTGNTVYVGLGITAPREGTRWIKSITSIGFFCIGSVFFSFFHRYFSPTRRWVLCASFVLQMLLILVAATILTFVQTDSDTSTSIGWPVLVPIALVAFQSCGQAVVSRALKYNALTSVVLTSIYCDLFSDVNLLAVHNSERNRRMAAPLFLLVGAVLGGLLAHSSFGCAGALWAAAGLKLLVAITWFFWPAAK